MKILLLLAGGAFGTLSRYLVSGLTHNIYFGTFPLGTMIVNLSGSFIVGLLWGMSEVTTLSSTTRTFLFIGVLGGFTTFSSYALETLNLFRDGELKLALFNVLANNIIGIALVVAGYMLSKYIINVVR